MSNTTPLSPLSSGQRIPVSETRERRQNTYLDTRVTSEQKHSGRQRKRASQDRAERRRTKRHLTKLAQALGDDRLADRLRRCHSSVAFLSCGRHTHNYIPNYVCEFRLCPNCGRRRAKKTFRKYYPRVLAFVKDRRVTPCHLVLTQERRKGEDLDSAVARIRGAVKRLYKRKFWKECFRGGLWSIEFTWDGEAYHAHLHLLVFRAKFCDVNDLRREWAAVKGGKNLRIERITDVKKGLREVLKYIAKPLDTEAFTAENLRDVLAMKGKRFFGTFGEFYTFGRGFNEDDHPEVMAELQREEAQELAEGMPCPDCGDPLFELRQTEDEHIEFLRRVEWGSLPDG